MDLQPEELQFLSLTDIIKESISIPKLSPKTFYLITLTLVFPLSFGILAHSLFTHPILARLRDPDVPIQSQSHQWFLLIIFQFFYLLFLFTFSLLSTAAVVFTVASIYTSKPVSFSSTLAAIPSVFRRLFITFLWVCLLMLLYNVAFIILLVLIIVAVDNNSTLLLLLSILLAFGLFLFVHVYITALWHLASVVSVLEPVYGFAAMKKSYELLKGKVLVAGVFVFGYLSICGLINGMFGVVVIYGDGDSVFTRIVVGGFLVGILVIVNLVGLLVQSVFYYVCKSFHHQGIDKSALNDHLGGYLGEYVPLKSSIQLESLDI
ncbi:hypothetical protein Nepgr_029595 [Nepenthes gracilis]|uniref:Uncharacterized protein n=1 Tax=Nepenthes gracilis TaxID=150966 RepID=A0AAD3TFN0_NEPGR|nr:hypothetical protein Nepgr_029595 [Nepenthes gracilis]